jgi:hypothetical protein
MKLFLLATLLQGAADECPAYLQAHGYTPAVATLTRPYTECMIRPAFPMQNQLAERRAQCAGIRTRQIALVEQDLGNQLADSASAGRRHAASDTFDWIDHIAANLPGCETSVSIDGDGIESPHAYD